MKPYQERISKAKDLRFALAKNKRERNTKTTAKETRKERFARQMRKSPTPSESRLHNALSQVRHRCGWVICSQVVLGPYIADLYIPNLKVVIEVDGGYHQDRVDYDLRRDRWMWGCGYRVIRVTNKQVMGELDATVYKIFEFAGLGRIRPKAKRKYGVLPGLEKPV